ncbi:hypothetical protein LCGC14_1118560 [marine sediment metagenome]|uniref:Uncharacterized protein n=1 Tax=marine sediment metagenome TaxID=412755 RepID=A0A0F9QAJ2_9ZZZZ
MYKAVNNFERTFTTNIRIGHKGLDNHLVSAMGFESSLNYILRKEVERRFGSVENFLKEIGLSKYVEEIKKQIGI